jgi:T5SS/PEP-CTERM-associated repeat protein
MKRFKSFLCIIQAIIAAGFLAVTGAQAAITYSGDATSNYIGKTADGSLIIDGGDTLALSKVYMGYDAGVTGTTTVDGAASTLAASSYLYLGTYGTGVLNIINGGTVTTSRTGYLGYNAGSSGTATVDGPGSTLTNSSTFYVGRYGTGTINIINGGTVSKAPARIG